MYRNFFFRRRVALTKTFRRNYRLKECMTTPHQNVNRLSNCYWESSVIKPVVQSYFNLWKFRFSILSLILNHPLFTTEKLFVRIITEKFGKRNSFLIEVIVCILRGKERSEWCKKIYVQDAAIHTFFWIQRRCKNERKGCCFLVFGLDKWDKKKNRINNDNKGKPRRSKVLWYFNRLKDEIICILSLKSLKFCQGFSNAV